MNTKMRTYNNLVNVLFKGHFGVILHKHGNSMRIAWNDLIQKLIVIRCITSEDEYKLLRKVQLIGSRRSPSDLEAPVKLWCRRNPQLFQKLWSHLRFHRQMARGPQDLRLQHLCQEPNDSLAHRQHSFVDGHHPQHIP